eukprot:3069-Pelagomonas_calceolata.AAC.1
MEAGLLSQPPLSICVLNKVYKVYRIEFLWQGWRKDALYRWSHWEALSCELTCCTFLFTAPAAGRPSPKPPLRGPREQHPHAA